MPLDLNAGTQTASGPSRFSALERTAQIARELAGRSGLTDLSAPASLDLRFADQFGYRKNAVTDGAETFEGRLDMLATISRSSLAYNPNWSFRSGDAVGRLEEVAANVLRYNQPPNTAGGRLLETAAATNKNTNPRFEGAVEGSLNAGGALPANVTISGIATSAITVVSVGVVNGWPRLRLQFNGTPSSDIQILLNGNITASNGQTWATSLGLALVSGGFTNLSAIRITHTERDSGGSGLATLLGSDIKSAIDASHRRFFAALTNGNASTAFITPNIRFFQTGAVNFTVDLFLPQHELGSAATSPIMPPADSPAESTRAAESVTEGVTFTRASRAYAMDWNGQSGGRVGPLKEFLQNTACQGEWGLWQTPFAVTNKIRNPRGVGASGTTPPTHVTTAAGGATINYTPVTVSGWPGYRVAITGTVSGTIQILFDGAGVFTAAQGEAWTSSAVIVLESGTLPATMNLTVQERNSGGTLLMATNVALSPDRQFRHFFATRTFTEATTAYVSAGVSMVGGSGAVNCSFLILAPQLTKTAFPCLPVLPEPGVVAESTQAAEVCEISNGGWSNDNGPGTLFADFIPLGGVAGTFGRVLAYGSGASDYSAISLDQATSAIRVVGVDGAVTQWGLSGPSWVAGSRYRAAFSFASNDIHSAVNAVAADDTSATIGFGTSKLRIGEQVGALYPSPVPLLFKSIRYFPAALPDAEVDILGAAS